MRLGTFKRAFKRVAGQHTHIPLSARTLVHREKKKSGWEWGVHFHANLVKTGSLLRGGGEVVGTTFESHKTKKKIWGGLKNAPYLIQKGVEKGGT